MTSSSTPRGAAPRSIHAGAAAWTLLVCLLLLLPGNVRPPGGSFPWTFPEGSDKLVHGLLFFIETRFLLGSFRHLRPGPYRRSPLAAAVLASVVLGVLTEVAQLWVPYRAGSGADLLADTLGACAYAAWAGLRNRQTGNTT